MDLLVQGKNGNQHVSIHAAAVLGVQARGKFLSKDDGEDLQASPQASGSLTNRNTRIVFVKRGA